jgi:ParB/RepB/Spo0J family partition protein
MSPATEVRGGVHVAPEFIRETSLVRRKHWGDMKGLTASIVSQGIIEPLIVRPIEGAGDDDPHLFELVCGARRLRGAKGAKLSEVPVIVRELTDTEALEIQAIENVQREDVQPLEEAEWYEALHEKGHTFEAIAGKVGKSIAYVYARAKLLALCPEARKALAEGQITASVALYVARIPHAKLQLEALKELKPRDKDDDPATARQAFEIISQRYMLRLVNAPFAAGDAGLLPKAGACTTCPKRTGNQAVLFEDVSNADVCTDPICYREKVDAAWEIASKAHAAAGGKVLTKAEARATFPYGTHVDHRAALVDLEAKAYDVDAKKTWHQVLKDAKIEPAVVLARDPEGNIRELVSASTVKRASRLLRPASSGPKPKASPAEKRKHRENEIKSALNGLALREIVCRAEEAVADPKPTALVQRIFRLLAMAMLFGYASSADEVCLRRGLEVPKGKHPDEVLRKAIPATPYPKLVGLVLELAIGEGYGPSCAEVLEAALKLFGVDRKKLREKAIAKVDKAEKPKGKGK